MRSLLTLRVRCAMSVVTLALTIVAVSWSPARADDLIDKLTVTIQPQYTLNTGAQTDGTVNGVPVINASGVGNRNTVYDWQLNYGLTYKISSKFSFSYLHTNLNFALGALNGLGAPITLGDIHDRFDYLTFSETPNPRLTLAATYYHRSREGDDVAAFGGINQNDFRIGETYAFGKRQKNGFPLVVNVTEGYANHPVPPNYAATNAALDTAHGLPTNFDYLANVSNGGTPYNGSQFFLPTYGVRFNVPTGDRTWVPYITYNRLATDYREDQALVLYNELIYGFTKGISKYVSFQTYSDSRKQFHQGLPIGGADTIRTTFWVTQLTYSLHK